MPCALMVVIVGSSFPASLALPRDTIRVEVGSPQVNGTVYPPHRGVVTMLRASGVGWDTAARWTNVLVIGDSAGRSVHRWHTGGWIRNADGGQVRFDLWQTFDARTLALYGYHRQTGDGAVTRLTIEGTRVRGTRQAGGASVVEPIEITLPQAGFPSGASDLIPQAVGLKEGLFLTAPVWNVPSAAVVTQAWFVRARVPVEFDGRTVSGWELEHLSADGERLGTIWLVDDPPYMVRWDVGPPGAVRTRMIGEPAR